MNNKNKIEKYIEKIQHAITVAGLNYDIWRIYKTKKYRKLLIEADDSYSLFFQTSIHAHFLGILFPLYRLFETRNDTVNFNQLLILLQQDKKFSKKDITRLKKRIDNMKSLWTKVSVLRNKVFGHESNKFSINPWHQAKITPNNIRTIIKKIRKLLNDISYKLDRKTYSFNLSAKSSTINLLKDLRKINKLYNNALHLTGRSAQSCPPE